MSPQSIFDQNMLDDLKEKFKVKPMMSSVKMVDGMSFDATTVNYKGHIPSCKDYEVAIFLNKSTFKEKRVFFCRFDDCK